MMNLRKLKRPNKRKTLPEISVIFLFLSSLLLLLYNCTATNRLSYFDKNPALLIKKYTSPEIKEIKNNFEANPLQYSQQMGDLLLWQMYQKSPEFALEIAHTFY